MKVETCIRLHCQTASMSATISKHYLPHLSAITTFYSVEYVAKVITILRINSQKKNYSSNNCTKSLLYKISPLGGASIHCKHLQFLMILMYITPSLTLTANMMDCVVNIKCLSHWQVSLGMLCTSKLNTITG